MGSKTITSITNAIRTGHAISGNWTNGTIVYMCKNKGDPGEWGNCRPICLTKIIYKIWPGLITRKLTKIMHILTRNNQFVYKEGISTIDAIIKIEQYVGNANRDAKILLMGISKAFGAMNRTLLWPPLYEKGIPIDTIKHIRQGHQGTRMDPKYKKIWGAISRQHSCLSMIAHKCPHIHNIHGWRDGWQRIAEPKIKPPHQNSTWQTCATGKTTPMGNYSSEGKKQCAATRTRDHLNNKKYAERQRKNHHNMATAQKREKEETRRKRRGNEPKKRRKRKKEHGSTVNNLRRLTRKSHPRNCAGDKIQPRPSLSASRNQDAYARNKTTRTPWRKTGGGGGGGPWKSDIRLFPPNFLPF